MDVERHENQIPSLPSETPARVPNETPPEQPILPTGESLRRLFRNRENLTWETRAGFQSGPNRRRKTYQLALWSLAASVIDGLLLIAMSCLFMMVFIKILRVPITKSVLHDFAVIFVIGAWMYMITTRFFIGCSIGEAACDLRLGKPQERLSRAYFLRVLVRASLVTVTGLFPLPLLGLLLGKDIPGLLSGLKLFSKK
jgi:hypothetical protein